MSSGRRPSTDALGAPGPWRTNAQGAPSPLESARRRLGGRTAVGSARAPGSLVCARFRDGSRHAGVVLWACEDHCDAWFDDGIARRTPATAAEPTPGPTPEVLARIAAEIRLFASLAEGERVCWERSTGVAEGRIIEKCRYGAIVVTRAGQVVAVGFRKLWPAHVLALA